MPPLIYELMDLYPQSGQGRPSVMYVPLRRAVPTQSGGTEASELSELSRHLEHDYSCMRWSDKPFVCYGTSGPKAQDAIEEQAKRVGMPYVNHRWLGGLLTNWRTISSRIDRLHELRRLRDEEQLELLPAKERLAMVAELELE